MRTLDFNDSPKYKNMGVSEWRVFCVPIVYKMEIKKSPKLAEKIKCECCLYECSKISDMKKHESTRKHKEKASGNKVEIQKSPDLAKPSPYPCLCGKGYKQYSGLWKHKKVCTFSPTAMENIVVQTSSELVSTTKNELIVNILKEISISNKNQAELKKQNEEIQNQLTEIIKQKPSTTTMINTNSNNVLQNTNNITVNMFLNEYCKNAMTLEAFMNSIEISMDDILYMAKRGNREGLTMILKNAFNQLQITERPVHCTDKKRHTTYIKEDAGWTKDSEQQFLGKLCRKTEHKGMQLAMKTINEDPEYKERGTDKYELRIPIMYETIGGKEGAEYNHPLVIRSLEEHLDLDKKMILETIEELKKI
jgi:hypothetical protein